MIGVSRRKVALVALAIAMLAIAGCAKKQVAVKSPWPKADSERTMPQPPVAPRWPYTGLDAPSAQAIEKRPLSIKIENSSLSRPQIGLNSPDVVYETITEGGITRFNCIFQSKLPKTVGPVRSARLSDLWVVPQYDGLFFFSGASSSVDSAVNGADLPNLSQDAGVSRPYWRSSERHAPHNLMLDTAKAYLEAQKRGFKITAKLEPLSFDRRTLEASPAVNAIEIPFSQANRVRWEWDSQSKRYLRWNNGNKHIDAATGKQVWANNVVVLWARYTQASHDMVGSVTFDVELGGQGRATIFRNGTKLDGTWIATRNAPPKFKAADGTTLRLSAGRTWFQVVRTDGRIDMR